MVFGIAVLLAPLAASRLMDAADRGLDGSWLAPADTATPESGDYDTTAVAESATATDTDDNLPA